VKVGSTITWLVRDHLQSVRLRTSATGTALEQAGYGPYGVQSPALSIEKGYIGERLDDETGLLYLNARYYDPALARFISPDANWEAALNSSKRRNGRGVPIVRLKCHLSRRSLLLPTNLSLVTAA
jgi:RHS repeat-associated protein